MLNSKIKVNFKLFMLIIEPAIPHKNYVLGIIIYKKIFWTQNFDKEEI